MNVETYLQRIEYSGSLEPTTDTLHELHRAHLLTVPFENLDIHIPREITLDPERIYAKIVGERRGGFCYELNGLFAGLLAELGFNVTLLSARVALPDGTMSMEFDHLLLMVDLGEPWLADVGFGESFRDPIRLLATEQESDGRRWSVVTNGRQWTLRRSADGQEWSSVYSFTLQPREFGEFAGMCHFHQSSPESHFTRNRIVSIATPEGRVSLTNERLIVTRDGQRDEAPIEGDAAWQQALAEHFGIVLPG